jgi:hypothetical protein
VLRVEANCRFTTKGFSVELKRPGSQVPAVRGPAIWLRASGAPTFNVKIPAGQFYALEVTEDLALFAESGTQNWMPEKVYATWQHRNLIATATVTLPADAWNRLKNVDCLFYRIRTSSAPDRWANVKCIPPPTEARTSPLIAIVDALGDLEKSDHLALYRLIFPPAGVPVPGDHMIHVTYSERSVPTLQKVTILPDGPTLDLDDVF